MIASNHPSVDIYQRRINNVLIYVETYKLMSQSSLELTIERYLWISISFSLSSSEWHDYIAR